MDNNTTHNQPVNPNGIPRYMKQRRQWLMWRYERPGGVKKSTKVPYQPNGRRAKSNDASTWSSFDSCIAVLASGNFDGIGFAFTKGDELSGIDLDHCFDKHRLKPWAQEIVSQFSITHIEISPSGDGLHIWCYGIPPATGTKKWKEPGTNLEQGIEVYNYESPRYLTVTGNIFRLAEQ